MKKTIISPLFFVFVMGSILFSCNKKQEFTVTGEIKSAENKVLYLEQVGVSKISVLDSLTLSSEKYKFKHARPATPDFFRLRLGNQIVNFVIDSTETIVINADYQNFATQYSLDKNDIENQKIKDLTLLQLDASRNYNSLINKYESGEISSEQYAERAYETINNYKNKAKEYIHINYLSPVAYFALFQQINNMLIFDPNNKEDSRLLGAVANSWNFTYPESPRAIQLKNIFANSRANTKVKDPVVINSIDGKTLFDISLPSIHNKEVRMSEACEGKVTLIDFTAYSAEGSPAHNLLLAEIYEKDKSKGLEIYQVSLDEDSHIWKNAAVNLPWICVRDPESLYSKNAQTYNVSSLPATFIMNKNGEVVYRVEDYSLLKKELSKYLK